MRFIRTSLTSVSDFLSYRYENRCSNSSCNRRSLPGNRRLPLPSLGHPAPIALGGAPPSPLAAARRRPARVSTRGALGVASPPGRARDPLRLPIRERVLSRPAPDPLRARSHKRRDASRVRHVREPLEGCYRPRQRRRVTRRARGAGSTERRAEPFAERQEGHLVAVVGPLAGVEVEQPHQAEHVPKSGPAIRHPGDGGTGQRGGEGRLVGKVGPLRVLGYVSSSPSSWPASKGLARVACGV